MATVAGLFERYEDADTALHRLNDMGYGKDQISIVASQQAVVDKLSHKEGTKETGAATGALVGGLAGLLFGVGTLIIPGVGPIIGIGSLATVLGSTAAGAGIGAAAGGFRGILAEMDIPEADAKLYETGIRRGGILITVIAEGEENILKVKHVFSVSNAVNLDTRRSTFERDAGEEYQDQTHEQEQKRSE